MVKDSKERVEQQTDINSTKEDAVVHLRKRPDGKVPGPHGLHGSW